MITKWDDLSWWKSDECIVMHDRMDMWKLDGKSFNPDRELVYAALDATPLEDVKVMLVGQDPYPEKKLATGIAFSIPKTEKKFPPTLQMIFKEYEDDLHYPYPTSGDLSPWTAQGVLLWNAVPTCFEGESLSHNFPEWRALTKQIVSNVSERGGVFVFLGSLAREFAPESSATVRVLETGHPSPRGNRFSKKPFLGSRIFSRINAELVRLKKQPIDWRLP